MFNGKSDRRVRAGMIALAVLVCVSTVSLRAETAAERLGESATVLKEVMEAPDKGIPEDLLKSAYCVVIVPGVRQAALGIGAKYGRGFAVCRKSGGADWGPPAAVRMEGGSVGFQIGVSETDVVMLVMDQRSMSGILSSKFTLGGIPLMLRWSDRKSTRLNSSHLVISYAVFCLKKKNSRTNDRFI